MLINPLETTKTDQVQTYFSSGGSLDEVTKIFTIRANSFQHEPQEIARLKERFSYCIELKERYYQENTIQGLIYFILALFSMDSIHRASKALTDCNYHLGLNMIHDIAVENNPPRPFISPVAQREVLSSQAAFEIFSANQNVDWDNE